MKPQRRPELREYLFKQAPYLARIKVHNLLFDNDTFVNVRWRLFDRIKVKIKP